MTAIEALPEPLVPADVDLRKFPFMPIDIMRLFASAFHARASDAEWRAGMTLWMRAWHQVPASSLPSDDIELCRLAELGRDMRSWRKVKAMALHGFVLCSDGRLYHRVLAEVALDAYEKRLKRDKQRKGDSERLRRWREKRRLPEMQEAGGGALDEAHFETRVETPTETRFERKVKPHLKRVREGEGEGEKESLPPTLESLPRESAAESNPDPKPEAEAPKPKPRMPRPDEPLPPPTPAEALCRDLADIRDALWPPVNGWHPGATDLAAAARWLDRWTHAGIVDAARSAMEGKHRADSRAGRYDPISSLARYLGPILERELAAAAPPPPPDAPVSAEVLANRAKILGHKTLCEQLIEGWRRRPSSWNRRVFGPPPDEPGCEIPPDLLRNAGITPHPGVAQ